MVKRYCDTSIEKFPNELSTGLKSRLEIMKSGSKLVLQYVVDPASTIGSIEKNIVAGELKAYVFYGLEWKAPMTLGIRHVSRPGLLRETIQPSEDSTVTTA